MTPFMWDWALGHNCHGDTTSETISGWALLWSFISFDHDEHDTTIISTIRTFSSNTWYVMITYTHIDTPLHNTTPLFISHSFRQSHGIQGHPWLATSQQHGRPSHQSGWDGDRWHGLLESHGYHHIPRDCLGYGRAFTAPTFWNQPRLDMTSPLYTLEAEVAWNEPLTGPSPTTRTSSSLTSRMTCTPNPPRSPERHYGRRAAQWQAPGTYHQSHWPRNSSWR